MADRGMDVDRLDRIAAPEVNHVEGLAESDEVAIILDGARPAAAGAIGGIGRAGDRAEGDMPAADRQIAGGIARVQSEFLRREPDPRFDQRWIESHTLGSRI